MVGWKEAISVHKRWGRILIIVVAMLAVCGGLASAHLPVQVLVDGKELEAKRPPQIVEGTVLVPVRTLAEALGATVDWDAKTRTVHVDNRAKRSLERRVARLEEALAPETPQAAVHTWARGVKVRNGALQFAVMTPELKAKMEPYLSPSWVTGVSSPWVDDYTITEANGAGDRRQFTVRFALRTSTGPAGSFVSTVTVERRDNHWYVAAARPYPWVNLEN